MFGVRLTYVPSLAFAKCGVFAVDDFPPSRMLYAIAKFFDSLLSFKFPLATRAGKVIENAVCSPSSAWPLILVLRSSSNWRERHQESWILAVSGLLQKL